MPSCGRLTPPIVSQHAIVPQHTHSAAVTARNYCHSTTPQLDLQVNYRGFIRQHRSKQLNIKEANIATRRPVPALRSKQYHWLSHRHVVPHQQFVLLTAPTARNPQQRGPAHLAPGTLTTELIPQRQVTAFASSSMTTTAPIRLSPLISTVAKILPATSQPHAILVKRCYPDAYCQPRGLSSARNEPKGHASL
jgi:hypothetical protein